MDMSAIWKGFKNGEACKRERFFCHCCVCKSSNVRLPNEADCDRFCSTDKMKIGDAIITLEQVLSKWS
jgi:hypothetical protein